MRRIDQTDYLTIVTLSEAKTHLRVTPADDDAYITTLIKAACEHVESLGQFWLGQDVSGEILINAWPARNRDGECIIYIPISNCTEITGVQYNPGSALIDFDDVEFVVNSNPAEVLVLSQPLLGVKRGAIKINFKAGFSDTPSKIKQAILLACGNMYEYRQEEIVGTIISKSQATTIDNLIRNYKLYMPV